MNVRRTEKRHKRSIFVHPCHDDSFRISHRLDELREIRKERENLNLGLKIKQQGITILD